MYNYTRSEALINSIRLHVPLLVHMICKVTGLWLKSHRSYSVVVVVVVVVRTFLCGAEVL